MTLSLLAALAFVAQPETVTYKSEPRDLVYYVYDATPAGERAGKGRPAVVFFHGGAWINGNPNQFEPYCKMLADRGLVGITVEYRLKSTDDVLAVECVRDAWDAWEHVVANAESMGIDPQRVGVGGGSAGGHIAACLGTGAFPPDDPRDQTGVPVMPAAMLLFNPGVCMAPFEGYQPTAWENGSREQMGCDPADLSAMHHLAGRGKDAPPTLIQHGSDDDVIAIRSVSLFVERLQQYGVKAELKAYPGRGHGFFNYGREPDHTESIAVTERFLTELGWIAAEN